MEAPKNDERLNCCEDTRKAGGNREDAGTFEADHIFANDQ